MTASMVDSTQPQPPTYRLVQAPELGPMRAHSGSGPYASIQPPQAPTCRALDELAQAIELGPVADAVKGLVQRIPGDAALHCAQGGGHTCGGWVGVGESRVVFSGLQGTLLCTARCGGGGGGSGCVGWCEGVGVRAMGAVTSVLGWMRWMWRGMWGCVQGARRQGS